MRKTYRKVAILLLSLSFSSAASALPIIGDVAGVGGWNYSTTGSVAGGDLVETFNLLDSDQPGAWGIMFGGVGGTHDFSAVNAYKSGDIVASNAGITATDWRFGTGDFTALIRFTVSHVSRLGTGVGSIFRLRGEFTDLSTTGLDPTPGALTVSTNKYTYSFAKVPEPGSVALLAIGLVGLVLMRRKKEYVA